MDLCKAKIKIESDDRIGKVDERLFGAFVEHLGRAIYGGIYEPGHPEADANGFRKDVLLLVRELNVPVIRYPGGNYVSGYKWEDSIGPLVSRPSRLDLAWSAVEPNIIGLHEFVDWARLAGSEIMMAINLGTRGIEEARNVVEYCNHKGGSYWSDLRKKNGAVEPFGFKVWCLGNEMDGPWQIGYKTAEEYGKLAEEVAKAIKLFDSSLELVVCGSSGPGMSTFPQWEATVLEHSYEHVDYISLHTYAKKIGNDSESFLAESIKFENFIKTVESTVEFVKAKKRSSKTVKLSVDEWNVWYHSLDQKPVDEPWTIGRRLLEDIYTQEDAVVVGCFLIVLLRHAQSVRMACLAQLINTIAPIMAEPGENAFRQTIFYPFLHCSALGRGEVLRIIIESDSYKNKEFGDVPYLDSVAVLRREENEMTMFCVNRNTTKALTLTSVLRGFEKLTIIEHICLFDDDVLALNNKNQPNRVVPKMIKETKVDDNVLFAVLPRLSWNVIRLKFKSCVND